MNLDGSKTTLVGDISVNILKSNVVFHFSFKTNSMNLPIKKGCFPEERKLAEVNPHPPQEKDDLKNITGLSVLYWTCQKSKESSIIKYMIT